MGFFSVIVAVLFLVTLSIALIYASFTSYKVKIASKRANVSFYNADAAVAEIKTGFQKVVSDSAKAGYERVLSQYSADGAESQTEIFRTAYAKAFEGYTYYDKEDKADYPLFLKTGSKISYVYTDGIKSFLSDELKANESITISSMKETVDKTKLPCEQDDKTGDITIKGVKVEYTRDGYTSYITTDIRLVVPQVTLSGSYDVGGLDKYVIIADKGYIEEARDNETNLTSGSAFFGELNLSTNARKFIVNDGATLIVGKVNRNDVTTTGDVIIKNNSQLILNGNSKITTLYANNIDLQGKAQLIETGSECRNYVADDLLLAGQSKATMSGEYFGFGDGSSNSGVLNSENASSSSSVIFPRRTEGVEYANGVSIPRRATLDLSNCSNFTLAGRSYITNNRENAEYGEIGMGSSITSQKEQLIYLIPSEFMDSASNPAVYRAVGANYIYDKPVIRADGTRGTEEISVSEMKERIAANLSSNTLLTLRTGEQRKAEYYGIKGTENIKSLVYPILGADNQWAVYYFFDFGSNIDNSNAYFKDYFSAVDTNISEYLADYANIIKGTSTVLETRGTGASGTGSDMTITDATQNNLSGRSKRFQTVYSNLSKTMHPESSSGISPFYTLVDVDFLNKVIDAGLNAVDNTPSTDGYWRITVTRNEIDNNGDPISKPYTFDIGGRAGASGDRCLKVYCDTEDHDYYYLIGKGTVTADTYNNLQRLIICDGDIIKTGNFYGMILCSGEFISKGCSGLGLDSDEHDVPEDKKGYSLFTKSGFYTGRTLDPNDDNWNMDDLVVFENWKKNEG